MRLRIGICVGLAAILAGCGDAGSAPGQDRKAFQAEADTVRAGGTEIAYYKRGDGPPLVLLMGTGSTMGEWDPALLRLLARDHRLILLDYPGVGLSGPWRGRSFGELADSVAAFMEAIELPEAAVLGWSMGGFVAQRLARDHPDRVTHLILAGTNPGGRRAVLGPPWVQAIDSDPDPSIRAILRQLYPPAHQVEGRRFLRRLRLAARRGEIPDDFEVRAATTDRQVAAEGPWLRRDRNYRRLVRITQPTLAAAGRRDRVTPPLNMRRIAARIPEAELLLLRGAHAFLFQQRRAFARAVAELTGR